MKELIVFIDSGDTLIDESTEVRDETGTVIHSELFPGAGEALSQLYQKGYTIALVADGSEASFDNIYKQHGLAHCFAARAISEVLNDAKPSAAMFRHAMQALHLTNGDLHRIVMVGNNLKRDIVGANRMGITSILLSCSPRYVMQPESDEEMPDYVVAEPGELVALLEQLDLQVKNRRILYQTKHINAAAAGK